MLYLSQQEHPLLINISKGNEALTLRVYIWNISHGGKNRPLDEYRIQVTGVSSIDQQPGETTLILGYWYDADVFAGFDYTRHNGAISYSPSFQIKEEYLLQAQSSGLALAPKGGQEIAVAFKPSFLGDYAFQVKELHQVGEHPEEVSLLNTVSDTDTTPPPTLTASLVSLERRQVVQTIIRKVRSASFQDRVLTAYGYRCAMCGLQLKLVEAAHILPVAAENSTDETSNGVALCALHHKAYDNKLLRFDEQYAVELNSQRVAALHAQNLGDGHDWWLEQQTFSRLRIPPSPNDRPLASYITEANKVRKW